jgi:hypothetical protein
MDLTFSIFRATIPRVPYVAIATAFSVPPNRTKAPLLFRTLCELRVKIPTQSFLPAASASRTTHALPSFSTANQNGPHTNSRKSFPLYRLLHTSLYTGENARSRTHPALFPQNANPSADPPSVRNSFKRNAYKKLGGGISTSRAIGSEPSARNDAGRSLPVFPFDFERSAACPEHRRVDLFTPARPLPSRNTRKSRISNAYRKQGGLSKLRSAALRHPPHYSLFTTHYSLPQSFRYTMPSREP